MLDNREPFSLEDPDALDACGRALNDAWETVSARQPRALADTIEQSTRRILAHAIVSLAATGERNVDELKRYALRDLSVWAWRQPVAGAPTCDAEAGG